MWPLSLALAGSGCNGGAGAGDTTSGSSDTGTAATSTDAPTTSTASTDPTNAASTQSPATDTTATEPSPTDGPGDTSESDTGPQGLGCPLGQADMGVEVLTLAPELFADGADPAGSESCAWVNPERGFFQPTSLRNLGAGTLEAAAAAGLSLIYGQVLLPEYTDQPIDDALLADVDAGFALAREHGFKVVPRFHYSNDMDEPDADLERVLGHIDQIAPLLAAHADVILTLQAGFIGAWGEWHSSQNGLDAPEPRKQILDALLAALPAIRTVSVRRPSFKQEAYAGPLTLDTAHDGGALARVGHINDCFLASDSDFGTYDTPAEKDYGVADSAFVPVGGETCAVNPPRSECPSALAELALHHWTYLNIGYNTKVLDSWREGGCFDEIACRLGYRLAVRELKWAAKAAPGGTLPVSLTLFNDGFAAPVNARPLLLVLDGPARIELPVADVDVRRWLPGADSTACVDALLPADLPPGSYRLGLRLPDAAPALADDPRQAIRLVNGEWTDAINWFDAQVEVE